MSKAVRSSFYFLFAAALFIALVAGFGMARGRRNWLSVPHLRFDSDTDNVCDARHGYPRAGLVCI